MRILAAASAAYLVGVGVTLAGNVPLNQKLAETSVATASPAETATARMDFEGPWKALHLVRTGAALGSLVLVSLAIRSRDTTDSAPCQHIGVLAVSTAWGAVLLIAAVLAGLQAGTYYTWATGVMPGLARTDDRTFVHATQQMSIAIVNPAFMLSFLGAPLFAVAAIVGAEPVRAAVGPRRRRPGDRNTGDHGDRQHPAQQSD